MIDYQYEKERRDLVIDAIKEDIRADLESNIESTIRHWHSSLDLHSMSRSDIIEILKKIIKGLK